MIHKKRTRKDFESLVTMLADTDVLIRKNARESLVLMGNPAISSLAWVLQNSKVYKVRWEAAKALATIGSEKAIPALVKALEDLESDVVWLAAEALKKFRKTAWPEILNSLIKRRAVSVSLRHAAHHVFRKQQEDGFNELLENLRKALVSETTPERIPLAAYCVLSRMKDE